MLYIILICNFKGDNDFYNQSLTNQISIVWKM